MMKVNEGGGMEEERRGMPEMRSEEQIGNGLERIALGLGQRGENVMSLNVEKVLKKPNAATNVLNDESGGGARTGDNEMQ